MFETVQRSGRRHHTVRRLVASEDTTGYTAGAVGGRVAGEVGLGEAVAGLCAAIGTLAGVDLGGEADQTLLDAAVGLAAQAGRLAGVQTGVVERIDAREAYGCDGAVTAASWLRGRTRCNPGAAAAQVQAARRLRDLPALRASLEAGRISWAHVVEITRAAIPARMPAIAEAEATLVGLAERAQPRDVRRAVAAVRDHADPDGADGADPTGEEGLRDAHGRDARRQAWLYRGIDGLWELRATLDTLAGEAMATYLDAVTRPDPADPDDRRTPAQRRADAIGQLVSDWLDRGQGPTRQGAKPHLLATIDLTSLLSDDAQAAARDGRLRFSGDTDPEIMRRFVAGCDPKLTVILTLGPWRVVNVGRTRRTLPAWLRAILEGTHRHCRGPDCDRPATWTHAHHIHAWTDGGDTDLNGTIPLCAAHHDLITTGGWTATLDLDTGIVTWTSPTGRIIHVHPPR